MEMNKRGIKNKKGQSMSVPFKMIFSIIMVAVVIFVGFYVIRMFLDRAEQVKLNTLPREIREAVVNAWSSSETERTVIGDCSEKVEYVCFVDFSKPASGSFRDKYSLFKGINQEANFFYFPPTDAAKHGSNPDWSIKCGSTDCLEVPQNKNPLCVEVVNGKVVFKLTKEHGQPVVVDLP
jgi:hypothetical protein